jgi:23S rRNA (uridine2552-2'-O)-methyltransferase
MAAKPMIRRTKSSKRWLSEHEADDFVKRARAAGWRSRAVFKLDEIQQKDGLIRPGMTIVDLGAAPGAWSQYAMHAMKDRGEVIAVDLLPIEPIPGVTTIQGDFREDAVLRELEAAVGDRKIDLVLSDMAPNISGVSAVDQPRSMYLAELALDFARGHLAEGGSFVAKLFQGEGFQEFVADARRAFGSVKVRKPKASRPRSREVYLVARNHRVV